MPSSNLYNSAEVLRDLIRDNWSIGTTPQIDFVWEEKSVGFADDRRDVILVTATGEATDYFGLYGKDFYHSVGLRLEVYSYQNLQYHENMVNELFRILKDNIKSASDYVILLITGSYHENDAYRNIYKHTITLDMKKLNP
tara:strand:- start:1403 stop:1822 length:420 start_codon:yes stop_codon:yes gene_type:complete